MKNQLTALLDILVRNGAIDQADADSVLATKKKGTEHKFSDFFTRVWNMYPKRNGVRAGKLPAWEVWKTYDFDNDGVLYSKLCNALTKLIYDVRDNGALPKDMCRWLKTEPWLDDEGEEDKPAAFVEEEDYPRW